MRALYAAIVLAAAGCVGGLASGPPVAVHSGPGASAGLVLDCETPAVADGARSGCWRADHADGWRQLQRRLGGELIGLRDEPRSLVWVREQVVVVVADGDERLVRIDVTTEEGVDVITLVTAAAGVAAGRTACLLRLARAPNQLAIVLRSETGGGERTAGVFDGL